MEKQNMTPIIFSHIYFEKSRAVSLVATFKELGFINIFFISLTQNIKSDFKLKYYRTKRNNFQNYWLKLNSFCSFVFSIFRKDI